MKETIPPMKISELEQIEFSRRQDTAYSLIDSAVRKLTQRAGWDLLIKDTSKSANSPWLWLLFVGGIVLQYFISGGEGEFGIGTWVAVTAGITWGFKRYELSRHKEGLERCIDKLYDYEVIWNGATGYRTFWDLQRFVGKFSVEDQDEKFESWWMEQRQMILEKVCGYEKGEALGAEENRRRARFKKMREEFRPNHVSANELDKEVGTET